jgi:hypothetical protein
MMFHRTLWLPIAAALGLLIFCDKNDSPTDSESDNTDSLAFVDLSGRVSHELDGYLPGVQVRLGGNQTRSDDSGYYGFSSIPFDADSLSVNHPPYDEYSTQIVASDSILIQDISLERAPASLYGMVTDEGGLPMTGATVSIDSLIDTTDATGYYSFENLALREYVLSIVKTGYYSYLDTLLVDRNLERNASLGALRIDTLWITEDASVRRDRDSDVQFMNFGHSSGLFAFIDRIIEWDSVYYDSEGHFYIRLPTIEFESIDSAVLLLTLVPDAWSCTPLWFERVGEDWDERTITWSNQPSLLPGTFESDISSIVGAHRRVRLSDDHAFFSHPYGFRVRSYSGSCHFCTYVNGFYSSDHETLGERPRILIYK